VSDTQSVEGLEPNTKLTGKVKRVELTGAILDIGKEYDALLHNSQIDRRRTVNARSILEVGKEIDVWVTGVDHDRKFVLVSMVKPAAVSWDDIKVGEVFKGTVTRIKKFGVFVDFGAERPGLVHISELSHDYVTTPTDRVQKGDEVEVKVIGVDREKMQIDLSIKALESVPQREVNEPEESLPTAMALAFERAMSGAKQEKSAKKSANKKAEDAQEDILQRTLKKHKAD